MSQHGCVWLCNRSADKKVAIGYTYEESGVSGAGGANVDRNDDDDDDDDSSDEDIDLGWLRNK